MELLTGKARQDFENFISENGITFGYNHDGIEVGLEGADELLLHGLMIEWLDSIGVWVWVYTDDRLIGGDNLGLFHWKIRYDGRLYYSTSRQPRKDAIKTGIATAGEIYNELYE